MITRPEPEAMRLPALLPISTIGTIDHTRKKPAIILQPIFRP